MRNACAGSLGPSGAGSKAIQPDEMKKLAEYFREAVVGELGHAKAAFHDWSVELKQALDTHP
jgi:hypothetical protein